MSRGKAYILITTKSGEGGKAYGKTGLFGFGYSEGIRPWQDKDLWLSEPGIQATGTESPISGD